MQRTSGLPDFNAPSQRNWRPTYFLRRRRDGAPVYGAAPFGVWWNGYRVEGTVRPGNPLDLHNYRHG